MEENLWCPFNVPKELTFTRPWDVFKNDGEQGAKEAFLPYTWSLFGGNDGQYLNCVTGIGIWVDPDVCRANVPTWYTNTYGIELTYSQTVDHKKSAGIGQRWKYFRATSHWNYGNLSADGYQFTFEINGQAGERIIEIEVLYQCWPHLWAVLGLAVSIEFSDILRPVWLTTRKVTTNMGRVFKPVPDWYDKMKSKYRTQVLKPPNNGTIVGLFGVLVRAHGSRSLKGITLIVCTGVRCESKKSRDNFS